MVGKSGEPWNRSAIALTKKQSLFLMACGFPVVMLHLIDYTCQISPEGCRARDLDAIDFFSGEGSIYHAYGQSGLEVKYYEILKNGVKHDMNSVAGLCQAVQYVLRGKPSALVFGGPPCSSFIWLNSATSKRSKKAPFGDTSRNYVNLANQLTCRWALLLILCMARQLFHITEQPVSSVMKHLPYIKFVIRVVKKFGLSWFDTFLYMGAHGAMIMKPTQLWGTAPFASKLRRQMTKAMRARIAKTAKQVTMVKKRMKNGKTSVSGGPFLKKSSAYPKRFGTNVCKYHQRFVKENPCRRATPDFDPNVSFKAPLNWKHAGLDSVRLFLKEEIARGNYKPIIEGGL